MRLCLLGAGVTSSRAVCDLCCPPSQPAANSAVPPPCVRSCTWAAAAIGPSATAYPQEQISLTSSTSSALFLLWWQCQLDLGCACVFVYQLCNKTGNARHTNVRVVELASSCLPASSLTDPCRSNAALYLSYCMHVCAHNSNRVRLNTPG